MVEGLRSADSETVKAAVSAMETSVRNLDDLVGQLKICIDVSERVGGVLSVDVYESVQVVGKNILGSLQNALDRLTEPVTRGCDSGCGPDLARDPRPVAPILGEDQPDWEGTVRGGTDTD